MKSARVNVVIEVTEEILRRIALSTSNSSVKIADKSFPDVTVDLLNGDIELDRIQRKCFCRTSRGNVKVTEGQYKGMKLFLCWDDYDG